MQGCKKSSERDFQKERGDLSTGNDVGWKIYEQRQKASIHVWTRRFLTLMQLYGQRSPGACSRVYVQLCGKTVAAIAEHKSLMLESEAVYVQYNCFL